MAASLPGRGRRVKRALVHRSEEPDQAPEKALRLSERELEDHANRQCDLDRNPTPATTECYDSSFGWGSPSVIERSGHCLTDGRGDASEPLPPPWPKSGWDDWVGWCRPSQGVPNSERLFWIPCPSAPSWLRAVPHGTQRPRGRRRTAPRAKAAQRRVGARSARWPSPSPHRR